jgi:xanthine dehydrogenase accessory factor
MARRTTARATELAQARVPFVRATVVRAQSPTSARAGDDALVLADGSMEGFVGGQCAEESVRSAALDVFRDGEALLLRVLPAGAAEFPEAPGSRVVVNPCLSGGALEIFLEPVQPPPLIHVVGFTPTADALASLAGSLGFAVDRPAPDHGWAGAVAMIVASHGHDEHESIRAALDAGIGFVGLVASLRRGEAVLAAMELTKDERRRVHSPVGLEIGARTPEEIALSILAEVVRAIRVDGLAAASDDAPSAPLQSVDPVCGMTVVVGPSTPHLQIDGRDHWFCSASCQERYASHSSP